MKKVIKRHLTLLELMIAMGLTMVILTSLFYFYGQLEEIDAKSKKIQTENFQERFFENKLSRIFSNLVSKKNEKEKVIFFSSRNLGDLLKPNSPSLVFLFDNGPNMDQSISNIVLARLYIDQADNLSLSIGSPPNKGGQDVSQFPMRKEILLKEVKNLFFEFFVAPEKDRTNFVSRPVPQNEKPPLNSGWINTWAKENEVLPSMIKMHLILKNGEEKVFGYSIPKSTDIIVYEE